MFKKILKNLSHRPQKSSKYDFGHILIIAGSSGMVGAPLLAAQGAFAMGSGLVTLAVPKSLAPVIGGHLREAMLLPLPETDEKTISLIALEEIRNYIEKRKVSTILIGPGLSNNASTQKLIKKILTSFDLPTLVDADALNALAHDLPLLEKLKDKTLVLTPNLNEFSRLTGRSLWEIEAEKEEIALEFARKYDQILVLKGNKTLVCSHKSHFTNRTGNPGMATAGAGDVLGGMIAALLGQKQEPYQAAELGVYLHGQAGDLAEKELTQISLTASDIVRFIPEAIKDNL